MSETDIGAMTWQARNRSSFGDPGSSGSHWNGWHEIGCDGRCEVYVKLSTMLRSPRFRALAAPIGCQCHHGHGDGYRSLVGQALP